VNRLAGHNAWSLKLESAAAFGLDVAKTVDWVTQWVNDAAEELVTDRNRKNFTGAVDFHALFDAFEVSEDYGTDLALV
jgi:hypothetical protein